MIRVALVVLLVAAPAAAQTTPAAELAAAQRRFAEGDYQGALVITSPLVGDARLSRADLAEAMRLHGLSLFLLGRQDDAEVFLHQFLRLDPEAHLDPALVPPEAVAFLESIRSRHEGELRRLKPRPKQKRYWVANLVPPLGQIQNDQPVKAWMFGVAEVVFLATWIGSYAYLAEKCERDLTCSIDKSSAEDLKVVNLASGAAFFVTLAAGMIDGFNVYNCLEAAEQPPPFTLVPSQGGATLVMTVGF